MDKLATKKCFIEAGLKTPDYITVTEFQELTEIQQEVSKLGLPVVLKPTRNGSSIGISIIKNIDDLQIGLEKAFEFGYELLVEKYIKGRELTVGILDDKAPPIIEIKPAVEFYNYEAKYKDDRTKYLIVEKTLSEQRNTVGDSSRTIGFLSPATYNNAQELAINAQKVIGCKGFSRVDMLLNDRDNLYLLEINTIPGFTEKACCQRRQRQQACHFLHYVKKLLILHSSIFLLVQMNQYKIKDIINSTFNYKLFLDNLSSKTGSIKKALYLFLLQFVFFVCIIIFGIWGINKTWHSLTDLNIFKVSPSTFSFHTPSWVTDRFSDDIKHVADPERTVRYV